MAEHVEPVVEDWEWLCGAFQPLGTAEQAGQLMPYRCTEPNGHSGPHKAVIDGEVVATWGRFW